MYTKQLWCLSIEIETLFVKIYKYFYVHNYIDQLQHFCQQFEYQNLLQYIDVCFLTLRIIIYHVLDIFKPLKNYILNQPVSYKIEISCKLVT